MHRRKLRYTPGRRAEGGPAPGEPAPALGGARVLGVVELTRGIRRILESSFTEVAVRGEVSGLSRPRSGHLYFCLREEGRLGSAQVAVVLWRDSALGLRFSLEDGMQVVVRGRLTVYPERGSYQVVAASVEPDGPGARALALERLKARLAQEGLFAVERKRPLPFLPRRIGVVTSPSGAALHDILRAIFRRHPRAWVRIAPARVQGEGAAEEVAAALERLGRPGSGVEVVIVGRGGGSPEDLWTFNEEKLVRAVAACPVPTVSAVGHEVDFTLCDLAADVRAQTPTQAGELVVPEVGPLRVALEELSQRLTAALWRRLSAGRERLDRLSTLRVLGVPRDLLERRARRLDDLGRELEKALYSINLRRHDHLASFSEKLEMLNPLSVLKRGYSVVFNARGKVARGSSDLTPGEAIRVLLGEGAAEARVLRLEEGHGE